MRIRGFCAVSAALVGWAFGTADCALAFQDVVRVINTTGYPSSDPSGLAYLPDSGTMLLSDSEIEETPFFQNANLYELTLSGQKLAGYNLTSFTGEPTGVVYHPGRGTLFISDDDKRRVFEADFMGSSLVLLSSFSTTTFGSGDPEDVTVNPATGNLFIVDGAGGRVYETTPAGALVSSFALPAVVQDGEGIFYNAASNTFFVMSGKDDAIFEVAPGGALLSNLGLQHVEAQYGELTLKSVLLAPTSDVTDDPAKLHIYIGDYGSDEANDGRLFELTLPGNRAPVLNPISNVDIEEGEIRMLSLSAFDPEGEPVVYSSQGLPLFATLVDRGDGTATLMIAPAAGDEGDYNVVVTVTEVTPDALSSSDSFTIHVRLPNDPPVVNAGPDLTAYVGEPVLLQGSVTDDGRPGGPLQISWSKARGPGKVTFQDSKSPVTNVTFSRKGTLVLRLSANDGAATASDEVTVTVKVR